jgi:hypothetical protein
MLQHWPHHHPAPHLAYLDPDPVVPARAQQVVHHLKARSTLREVHCSDVDQALKLRVDVVAQEPAASKHVTEHMM